MPLKLNVENLDSVDEPFRELYAKQDDGTFRLKVEGVADGVEDVSGLKSALGKEREAAKQATARLRSWESLGRTTEELAEMLRAAEEGEAELKRKAGDFDALLAQHTGKWEKERTKLTEERDAALAVARRSVVDTRLLHALTEAGATPEGLDLLPSRLSSRVAMELSEAGETITIFSADGKTPMAGNSGALATFGDLAAEAVEKWPSLFKPSGNSGSGMRQNSSQGDGASRKRSSMTPSEKAAYIAKHGRDAYLKLPQ